MEMVKDDEQQIMKNPQQVERLGGIREEGKGMLFHVLAVDDSRIERKILEQLLTISSYQVTSVESGDKALEFLGLLDTSPPSAPSCQEQGHRMRVNLIMTDYSMPGMTGYDLLKRVKESSMKDVPVILMSSENVPSRIHMCLEEGAEEFLLKPVRMSDLKKLQDYVTRSLIQQRCGDEDDDPKARICLIEGNLLGCEENKEKGLIEGSDGKFGEMEETGMEMETQLDKRSPNNKVTVRGLADE